MSMSAAADHRERASSRPRAGTQSSGRPAELPSPDGKPVRAFASARKFEQWLAEHHAKHAGLWLRIFKKGSGRATVTYAEALDVALCYGWIDGQIQRGDKQSWLQRFTRRGKTSAWSKVNTGHVERLTREGRMQPAGLAAVQAAQADGRWAAAYGSSSAFEMPAEFLDALSQSPKAAAFYATLNKAHRYAIFYRLTSAKRPETRQRRLVGFIALLARGEKLR
jgi:uncharacterized protein YdeI (YjbR/CyaY-like superfamily)